MLAMTRELLLERLLTVSEVTDLYAAHDPAYVTAVLQWIDETERALTRVRNPIAGLAAAERGRVLAARDGFVDTTLCSPKTNPRKAERAAAAAALSRIEDAVRSAVVATDAALAPLLEQTAQLVAIASAQRPIPMQGSTPREEWLEAVWRELGLDGEKTRALHCYLTARLAPVDRLYLLGNVLDNALSNGHERLAPARRAVVRDEAAA